MLKMYVRADKDLGQAPQASTAGGGLLGTLFQRIRDAVQRGQEALAISLVLAASVRDENDITNLIFWARHPTRWGRKLRREDPNFGRLSGEWLDIRDRVRLALASPTARPTPGTVPLPTAPIAPKADQGAFLERILAAHIGRSLRTRGPAVPDLSDAQLAPVPGTNIEMRRDAAAAAGRLLAAANRDLIAAKAAGDPDALRTVRISGSSGYRKRAHQERLWRKYFPRYYARTAAKRTRLPGGPHGDAAVAEMVKYVSPKIAAPGFSRHQAGLAIDFKQERDER